MKSRISKRRVMRVIAILGTMVAAMVYLSGYRAKKEIAYKNLFNQTDTDSSTTGLDSGVTSLTRSDVYVYWVSYAVSTVATGLLVDMVGPKHIWGVGGLLAAFSGMLTIVTATVNPYVSLLCLTFTGFGLGVVNPCFTTMVAHWAPQSTRTLTMALIESGTFFGMLVEFVLHDTLTADNEGWKIWVYINCVASTVWGIVWYLLFYNKPAQHPHISRKELHYIRESTIGVQQLSQPRGRKTPLVPWKQILQSSPVWSLQSITVGSSWVYSLVFYHMDKYLLHVFNTVPGTYVNVVALGTCLCSLIFYGWISDKLIVKELTSRTTNRRLFLLFSNFFSACLLLTIPFLRWGKYPVLLAFFTLIHFQAMALGPMLSNAVDLSPRYAGLIQGFMTAGRAFTVLCCRELVKHKVDDLTIHEEWSGVFNISAILLILLSCPYIYFGSGEIQDWNFFIQKETTETDQTD